jgi:minor histocompatibility antigen H13
MLRFQIATLFSAVTLSYIIILPIKLQMLMYTLPIIYIASHLGIGIPNTKAETMTKKDAIIFPFIGSATLLSLYFAYKYVGPWLLNVLVSSYVSFIGLLTFYLIVDETLAHFSGKFHSLGYYINIPSVLTRLLATEKVKVNLSVVLTLIVGVLYFQYKHYILHNILAVSLAMQGIRSVSLGSFTVGLVLLWGLFFYDVFWVFGTDVMVTVAKNFDGPIKILLPLSFEPWKSGLLGLGDVVVPGMFISLCLRFDRSQAATKYSTFWAAYIGYIVGLLITGVVMIVFNAAQPALLYLVPGVTAPVLATAWIKGDLKEFWNYDEEKMTDKSQ